MIQRDSRGQIASRADVFAMHRRQMAKVRATSAPKHSHAGRMSAHTRRGCNTGGRLNGWPICWFCYVETMLDSTVTT